MPSGICAVLIADVMASSRRADVRVLLGKKLTAASKRHLEQKLIRLPYSVTAGDEFQTVVGRLASLPALLLDLRSSFQPLSLRVGIGIGRIADRIQPPVNRLSGEAFQFARSAIEGVKAGHVFKFDVLTAFLSRDKNFDNPINLIYGLHDTLVLQITPKQWAAIHTFLGRPRLEPAARRLQRDASTVSRNLKRGYYWQLIETARVAGSLLEDVFC
jgi:hypothetical protein